VSGNGHSAVWQQVAGNTQPAPMGWRPETARAGQGGENDLRIGLRGPALSWYLNGALLARLPIHPSVRVVGFQVCGHQTAGIEALRVRRLAALPPPVVSLPPSVPVLRPAPAQSEPCQKLLFLELVGRTGGVGKAELRSIRALQERACGPGSEGEVRWPSGLSARDSDGTWRYENGVPARHSDGTWRYPGGVPARDSDGTWRYPNGVSAGHPDGSWRYPNGVPARETDGTWRLPDGRPVESEAAVLRWACQKLGSQACDEVRPHLEVGGDWRVMSVVELALRAQRG